MAECEANFSDTSGKKVEGSMIIFARSVVNWNFGTSM